MESLGWRQRRGSSPAARRGARQRAGLTPVSASNILSCERETHQTSSGRSNSLDADHGIYGDLGLRDVMMAVVPAVLLLGEFVPGFHVAGPGAECEAIQPVDGPLAIGQAGGLAFLRRGGVGWRLPRRRLLKRGRGDAQRQRNRDQASGTRNLHVAPAAASVPL